MSYLEAIRAHVGATGTPETGPDPVNLPMIRHWCEAIGDENPVYLDEHAAKNSVHGEIIAPPTMLQAWVMRGFKRKTQPDADAADSVMKQLDDAGFTSVVATNCEQTYHRELHVGDQLTVTQILDDVSDLKRTALGEGHFVTSRMEYRDADGELVATMFWRLLKFRPPAASPASKET